MAPFLRIAFNSYELGSLQAADDASQPFCAVKMKEALCTGTAGGYTLPEWWQQPGGAGSLGPAGGTGGARPCLPRMLLFLILASLPIPAVDAGQQRPPNTYSASSTGCMEPSLELGVLAPPPLVVSPNSFHVSICARPNVGHLGQGCVPGLTWPCLCGAHSQVGDPDQESCDWEVERKYHLSLRLGRCS